MSLADRIIELRRNIAQAERDHHLEARWRRELAAALRAQREHVDHAHPLPRSGVDYAYGGPSTSHLRAAGASFVMRYVSPEDAKNLSRDEARSLTIAGIDVGVVWESSGGRMQEGAGAGKADARVGVELSKRCGIPDDRPVYFALDIDPSEADLGACHSYIRAAVSELGWTRVGVYGGLELIEYMHAAGACRYFWQTLAWSGGRWSPHAQLRQVAIGQHIGGAEVDIDKAVAADFGQWRVKL